MWDNARYKPLEPSPFFGADQSSSRTLVPQSVPYQQANLDTVYFNGKREDGSFVTQLPPDVELTRELLYRGMERFTIYCTPCHGFTGDGNGMIVQRGFPLPPSYNIDRLRVAEIGYFYDVMTNGFGRMYSYASRVSIDDRWAIAAYIKALQLSQAGSTETLPAGVFNDIKQSALNPPAAVDDHGDPHGDTAAGAQDGGGHGETTHEAAGDTVEADQHGTNDGSQH
jgi:mono/diheme cytochrome c family protein